MRNKGKYIGVESRVQYEVLEAAVHDYLYNVALDKEKCLSHIKQFTKGENRAGKILKHVSVLITKNEIILTKLSKHIDADAFTQLSPADRKAMLLCLFCNSFPITYDILIGFAQAFKVQSNVSKEVIIHKIGSAYGSNRAMHIAITEIIPLLISFGVISRTKPGIYTIMPPLKVLNVIIIEFIVYSDIALSGTKTILVKDVKNRAWYSFFNFDTELLFKQSYLLRKQDSSVGSPYLSIKS